MSGLWPWIAVGLLGVYHGIDPSMGWLFAVALGLQERSRAKVIRALVPIAAGHLISIAAIAALVSWARIALSDMLLRAAGGGVLIAFGLFRFLRPTSHPRWVAMKVNSLDLALWSFLMASAHGAGLMLLPIIMGLPIETGAMRHHPHGAVFASGAIGSGVAVACLHTASLFVSMGAVALLVYDWLGLAILRSAWINLDTIWAGALVGAGLLAIWI